MAETLFDLSGDICYLNHAAVAPWPASTVAAVEQFARENGRLGSLHYPRWLTTEQALREQMRSLVNAVSCDEIALLKNTSEALSVVAYGLDWAPGDEVIISDEEFPSNRIVWDSLQASFGIRVVQVRLRDQSVPENAVINAITSQTRLISISSVQYGSGLALDLASVGEACRQAGIVFCVDAIQSIGVKPFDVQACHIDFAMADGHKWMLGPEGLALFYCRKEWQDKLALKQFGWHMVENIGDYDRTDWRPADSARRFECGSPNMLAIHALHASLSLLLSTGIDAVFKQVSSRVEYLIEQLQQRDCEILSVTDPGRRAGIVTFRRPDVSTEKLHEHLMAQGVICAMRAGGIRFSPHFYTPFKAIDRAINAIFTLK